MFKLNLNVRNNKCNVHYTLFQMFCGCFESCRNSQPTIEVGKGILENAMNDEIGHNMEQPKTKETLEMPQMV